MPRDEFLTEGAGVFIQGGDFQNSDGTGGYASGFYGYITTGMKLIGQSSGAIATVSNIRPTSRGFVNITNKDSRIYAKVKLNYLSTQHDRMIAAKGLKLTRKIIMESETFKKYRPEEYRPGININDDEELVKAGSDYAQTIFHPVGTCKMGQDDMAVVDETLKVKGLKNLRVIDASIMPNITSGNTNAPTIMIAEKGADMILRG